MINGIPGLALNAVSILVLSATLTLMLLSIVVYCRPMRSHWLTADARQSGLWLLVAAPWIVGSMAALIVLSLNIPRFAASAGHDLIHWHHPTSFIMNSWHGYFLLAMLSLAMTVAVRVLRQISAVTQLERTLLAMSCQQADGAFLLDAETPAAFTTGLRQPRFFLTHSLLKALAPDEYKVIRLHEMTHVRRRDPLRKTVFQLLSGFFPRSISKSLNVHMNTAMEQFADATAATTLRDRALIARVLLKVRRLTGQRESGHHSHPGICHFGPDDVQQRIGYLLADRRGQELSIVMILPALCLLSVGCAVGADSVHHFIEHLLQH